MARNAEKALTTLARWRAAKEQEAGKNVRRPYLASECTDVGKCEKWRIEIIREIAKKVAQIQNGKLSVEFHCLFLKVTTFKSYHQIENLVK